ncbi:MAG: methyltransferase domain-containing protein [Bacteroidetes bacterium]|nr:methyltransferase domain-containing protein [Bacteroidota bacterium]
MMEKDIIGAACMDYFVSQKEAKIIVTSSIPEKSHIPVSYLFRSYEEMPELEKTALKLCKGKILELGGGVGSHALELQKSGLDVTLLDSSALCCEIALKRGVAKVVHEKLENFSDHNFDTILLLMNGIGISGTLNGLDVFLEKSKKMLNQGGQIIFDSCDILYMFENEDGSVSIDLNAKYYGEVVYTMSHKKSKGNPFPWLFISADMIKAMAEQRGYKFEILYQEEEGMYLARLTL